MVTLAEEPEVRTTSDAVEGVLRSAIAGHPQGAVRRIVLYIAVYVALTVAMVAPDLVAFVAGGTGFVALLLLATTDQLA